ncbi:MAG: hypothetical protein WBG92_23515, partial [Thiohalocapsa sp.]
RIGHKTARNRNGNMSLISDLTNSPPALSTSSKFTLLNGLLYLAAGSILMIWPGAVQTLLLDPDFVGHEAALVRVLGMTAAVIIRKRRTSVRC